MNMKKYIKLICLLGVCAVIVSCKTKQKVTVYGSPGTEIYSRVYTRIGTIPNSGKLNIKLNYAPYASFLLSHNPGSDLYIPFAIDYKYKNTRTLYYIATITAAPTFGIPALLASPFTIDSDNYVYEKRQSINNDIPLLPYENTGLKRNITAMDDNNPTSNSNAMKIDSEPTSFAKARASKSTKTLKDFGRLLAGTYKGTGTLLQKENVVETYGAIIVKLKRMDKNTVTVEVIDRDGESFFSSQTEYSIKKNADNYLMSLKGIPSAIISIDAQGNLVYYHPKVNIEGEIYILKINAKKQ